MLRINSPCLRWSSGWWCQVGQGGGVLFLIAQMSQNSIDDVLVLNAGDNFMACHGMQGLPAALVWPVLAGQNAAYLQSQMAMFKSGQRVNSAMAAVLAPLSEKEFAALAAYYSQLQPITALANTYPETRLATILTIRGCIPYAMAAEGFITHFTFRANS